MVNPLAMFHLCDNPEVIHEHPEDGQDVHSGCHTHAGEAQGHYSGELIGYVDDGAFFFAHSEPSVTRVLNQKYNQMGSG